MKATKSHGCLGDNIKIHFAGAENMEFSYILHDAGVRYYLFTVLPFIMDKFNIKWGRITHLKTVFPHEELPKLGNHVIMDSGLFSIMFGACRNVKPDEKFIRNYKNAIVDFVRENNAFNITCVECDCQKLLGTDLAWELRREMREQLPNNRIINVFHFEDGKEGLDKLIDFSEYIAISVPELRIVKRKEYKKYVVQIAEYIKSKKPEIDIHLLGCTESDILRKCRFCTSADSTSWQGVNRWGRMGNYRTRDIKKEKQIEGEKHTLEILNRLGIKPNENRLKYYFNYWLAGKLLKAEYTRICGDQN